MATVQDYTDSPQEASRFNRIIWSLFNAEKDSFKVKVLFFSFDASSLIRKWITSKFGPEPL